MSGTVFELSPKHYLKYKDGVCEFAFAINTMRKQHAESFLVGDAFLKHYYSTYDIDNEEIGLGINIHSKGKVRMYEAPKLDDEEIIQEDDY